MAPLCWALCSWRAFLSWSREVPTKYSPARDRRGASQTQVSTARAVFSFFLCGIFHWDSLLGDKNFCWKYKQKTQKETLERTKGLVHGRHIVWTEKRNSGRTEADSRSMQYYGNNSSNKLYKKSLGTSDMNSTLSSIVKLLLLSPPSSVWK